MMCGRRRTGWRAAALAMAVAVAAPAAAAGPEAAYGEMAREIGRELIRLFPPADGYVVSAAGGDVYIDLAEKDLMYPGIELLVYRPGADIVHPVTGEVLGTYEESVGYLHVTEVREKYSRGVMGDGSGEVLAGDRIRSTARRLRVALSIASDSPAVDEGRLARALLDMAADTTRFDLLDEGEWRPDLERAGGDPAGVPGEAALLLQLGREIPADMLLAVSAPAGEDRRLDLQVRSLLTGSLVAEFSRPWPGGGDAPRPPDAPAPAGVRRELPSRELTLAATSLVEADLDGDGTRELLITGGRGLFLYRREGGGLVWLWEEKGDAGRIVLNLEAGDADGDGLAEIYTTVVTRGRLATEVWRWDGSGRREIATVKGRYLKVLDRPGGGVFLAGQRAGLGEVFSGRVEEYRWHGGECLPAGEPFPRGVNLFGLALADLDGDGEFEILSLNVKGRLRVFSREGGLLWESDERYAGYPAHVTPAELFGAFAPTGDAENDVDEDQGSYTEGGGGYRDAFQGRILSDAAAGGAGRRIALPRNFSASGVVLPRLRSFGKGEVVFLEWNGDAYAPAARSAVQGGYVSDVTWGAPAGDGEREVIAAVNRRSGFLLGEKGRLVTIVTPFAIGK